ncbi:MAG: hypothetical protein J6B39_05405 [Lachnospiraceae bacterium]|nr:hypothetical protein [Lachnospiraceae bacterium]
MKKFIHIFWGITIALTIIGPVIELAIIENDADMDNISKAFGAMFLFIFAGILLVIECGLYYNCIYFFIKKNKRVWKTIYNLVMLAISCTMIVSAYGMRFWNFGLWETVLLVLAISSVVLWFVYALICAWKISDDL